MEYKSEDGVVLKGFSQVDLELLNKRQRAANFLLAALVSLGYATFLIIVFVLYNVMRYNLVTKYISTCGG